MPDAEQLAADPVRGEVVQRRRRGEQLSDAIYQACVEELTEHGYPSLTMDRVAARARTGKATLYRRWPSKVELVADALRHSLPPIPAPPDTGSLRDDLLAVLRAVAAVMSGPVGAASRGLISEVVRSPDLGRILSEHLTDPVLPLTMEVLRRAVVRGEVSARAMTPRVAGVGGELVRQEFLLHDEAPEAVLTEIVDEVLLPLLRGIEIPPAPRSTN